MTVVNIAVNIRKQSCPYDRRSVIGFFKVVMVIQVILVINLK